MWKKIEERKWELKHDDVVLATIFHKPTNDKYSLWFKTPMIYEEVKHILSTTYQYDSFEDAKDSFRKLLLPTQEWCQAVIDYIKEGKE